MFCHLFIFCRNEYLGSFSISLASAEFSGAILPPKKAIGSGWVVWFSISYTPVLMAGTWKSAPANYFCKSISFYFRFQPLNFEGGTSPNLQFALNGCKENMKTSAISGKQANDFFLRGEKFWWLDFFVQNHESNNKQKMFLRDFPLSIPEWDFPKKEPMLFSTN